jgi:sortase A
MLLKVGIAMMAVALVFTAIAAGIAVSLRDEPRPAIAAKPASKSALEPPDRSYTLEDRDEQAEGQPAPESEPLGPQAEPEKNRESELAHESARESARGSAPDLPPEPRSQAKPKADSKTEPKPRPRAKPESNPAPTAEPTAELNPEPEREVLPLAEEDWPAPTDEELQAIDEPRHYELPASAIMGLTIRAMGLYNIPVFNSDSQWAFNNGVVHEPETSLPWSNTAQTNVFLAAHRVGYYGTSSRLAFFNLDKLRKGDQVVLKERDGKTYTYRVSETFVVDPTDVWVMGQVRGRDIVTLQTCTPIPTYHKRLIVRADRV